MADQKENKKTVDQKENKTTLTYEDLNFRNTVIDKVMKAKADAKAAKVAKQRVAPFKRRVADASNIKGVAGLSGLGSSTKFKL